MAVRTRRAAGHSLPDRVRARDGTEPGTAHLTFVDPGSPNVGDVREWCAALARAGYQRVVTGAVGPATARALAAAGFRVRETLDLLGRGLDDVPPPRGRTRRALHVPSVVALDQRAFGARGFDAAALRDARGATPRSRLRVAGRRLAPTGYALTGVAGWRAYVQRLAVDPGTRRRGTGRLLLLDGLRWARRRGARTAVVNTFPDNEAARALYESTGFVPLPEPLTVLERTL